MRTVIFLFLLITTTACNKKISEAVGGQHEEGIVKIMSYNIRLDHEGDNADNWHQRKADMVKYVQQRQPDFLGVQEALAQQVHYLDNQLPDYQYVGVGRDDGKKAGEFMAIFYQKEKWMLVKDSTFWLSATPDQCSRGWDAACHRTATIGLFKNKKGQMLSLVNTHFDHVGVKARQKSVDLLLSYFENLPARMPFVLMGDFNFTPDNQNYHALANTLNDTFEHASHKDIRSAGTFNGFKIKGTFDRRIDYIFISPENIIPLSMEIDTPKTAQGRQLSDHFPVIANIQL